MKRVLLILLLLPLLAGLGVVVWTVAGLPPVRMMWSYGLSYGPEPTGRTLTFEGVEFVEIGPGCFLMGSEKDAEDGNLVGQLCARFGLPWGDQPIPSKEMPVHWVEFARGFWIAKYEVTNEQFEDFEPGRDRSCREGPVLEGQVLPTPPGDLHPAVGVFWVEAKEYCRWLSERSGIEMRLPSEAEWEAACRGGSTGDYCFGSEARLLSKYAWFEDNCGWPEADVALGTHPVGTRQPNAWGLHDFHGNAWEWCEDTVHGDYEDAPSDGSAWTSGGLGMNGDVWRILRGGAWFHEPDYCRSAHRFGAYSDRPAGNSGFRHGYIGVRLAWSGW
jgi:formylglycine-generating enzyme required for sulfatase activity